MVKEKGKLTELPDLWYRSIYRMYKSMPTQFGVNFRLSKPNWRFDRWFSFGAAGAVVWPRETE